jgi:hypothetical protein
VQHKHNVLIEPQLFPQRHWRAQARALDCGAEDIVATGADAQLRWLDNWRGEEGAILAYIGGAAGELVALQFTHITLSGEKSTIKPVRKTIKGPHDWRRRGASRLGSAGATS